MKIDALIMVYKWIDIFPTFESFKEKLNNFSGESVFETDAIFYKFITAVFTDREFISSGKNEEMSIAYTHEKWFEVKTKWLRIINEKRKEIMELFESQSMSDYYKGALKQTEEADSKRRFFQNGADNRLKPAIISFIGGIIGLPNVYEEIRKLFSPLFFNLNTKAIKTTNNSDTLYTSEIYKMNETEGFGTTASSLHTDFQRRLKNLESADLGLTEEEIKVLLNKELNNIEIEGQNTESLPTTKEDNQLGTNQKETNKKLILKTQYIPDTGKVPSGEVSHTITVEGQTEITDIGAVVDDIRKKIGFGLTQEQLNKIQNLDNEGKLDYDNIKNHPQLELTDYQLNQIQNLDQQGQLNYVNIKNHPEIGSGTSIPTLSYDERTRETRIQQSDNEFYLGRNGVKMIKGRSKIYLETDEIGINNHHSNGIELSKFTLDKDGKIKIYTGLNDGGYRSYQIINGTNTRAMDTGIEYKGRNQITYKIVCREANGVLMLSTGEAPAKRK